MDVEATQEFNIVVEWSVAYHPQLSMSSPNISIFHARGANGIQRHCNVSLVFNELCIVTSQTQEASDILTIFRLRPIRYSTSHGFLGVHAVLLNIKGTKIDMLKRPGTFCTFGLDIRFFQEVKYFTDRKSMFCEGTAMNHNIVKVHDIEFVFHSIQHAFPRAHELAACIRQATPQYTLHIFNEYHADGCLMPLVVAIGI
jgi:hypothetical protein